MDKQPLRNALVMLPVPVPAGEPQVLLPGAVELIRITTEEWFPPYPGYRVVQLLESILSITKDRQIPMHTSKVAMHNFAELDVIRRAAVEQAERLKDRTAPPSNEERAKLWSLRKDYRKKQGHGYIDAENHEWHSMPVRIRMALLLLCGVDGDLDALALRDFQAMPPPERQAIKTEMRLAKRHFSGLVALTGVW